MRSEVSREYPEIASVSSWGTASLDLPTTAERILQEANIEVHRVAECTYTNQQLYSHRREPGIGRIAGFVWKP